MNRINNNMNLVICQKSKINDWFNHFAEHHPSWTVFDLTKIYSFETFVNSIPRGNHLVGIINYELAFRRKDLLKLKDFTMMLDESSLIQNKSAKQTKFILSLKPKNVILLSGTPTSGKYENLWTQAHLLGWNISEDLYNKQYVNWKIVESDGFFHKIVDMDNPYKNVERLKQKLRNYGAIFMKTEEVFSLPEQTFTTIHCKTTKEYRKFVKSGYVQLKDGTELIGDQIFKQRLYSRQLCGMYNQDKLDAFRELIQSTNDRVIVFYNFTSELIELESILNDLKRPFSLITGSCKRLDEYEQCNDSVTLIQYQAGSKGLNLQKANKIVYYTPTDKVDDWMQSQKRIHRIGQKKPCFYYQLVCENSIEEKIYDALQRGVNFTDELFKLDSV